MPNISLLEVWEDTGTQFLEWSTSTDIDAPFPQLGELRLHNMGLSDQTSALALQLRELVSTREANSECKPIHSICLYHRGAFSAQVMNMSGNPIDSVYLDHKKVEDAIREE
jgi:hypothetical protein